MGLGARYCDVVLLMISRYLNATIYSSAYGHEINTSI